MLSLFQRKKAPPIIRAAPMPPTDPPKGLLRPQSASTLLATSRRKKLLEHIWQRTALSRKQFTALYLEPLEHYAELVQQFPASESHHHAYPGGMLDHGLEVVAYALKLRQSYLLPSGTTPEDQTAQSEAWTAAAAYAALLHDIGKVAVDLHVEQADGSLWHPWHGPLQQRYRFRYRPDREYRLHSAASGLLYIRLLDRDILDWLSGFPLLWSSLLYVLAGQYEHAGVLGELVIQADRASVAQALGGDPAKAMAAPKHALQRKLLDGLRYLLREELKLNQAGPADGWLTQDALWLVSKTVSDKLRAHLLSQGIDGIPTSNSAVFNVLQDHGILQPTPDGKAIWRATISSDSGWSYTFTLLRLAPALIWEGSDRPVPFAGTVTVVTAPAAEDGTPPPSPDATASVMAMASPPAAPSGDDLDALLELFSTNSVAETEPRPAVELPPPLVERSSPSEIEAQAVFLDKAPAKPVASPSGEHFVEWLKQGVQSRKLIINDSKALVHTVANMIYLVSPGVFQRYAREHPQVASIANQEQIPDWQWVQKRFERLQLHRKQDSGLNIWTCEVTGPRKSRRLHGYLMDDTFQLFDQAPPNNPYLTLVPTAP
ncbi:MULTISPECIES: MobH family relaxase [Gammaproteobacteria]|uniref:MobH family relaxase n=1 Tax=Gammaproteobacteria TaxID=1236 RepID=UPI0011283D43|nr:MobH family relaxase [Pseudomonas sp. Hp2]